MIEEAKGDNCSHWDTFKSYLMNSELPKCAAEAGLGDHELQWFEVRRTDREFPPAGRALWMLHCKKWKQLAAAAGVAVEMWRARLGEELF